MSKSRNNIVISEGFIDKIMSKIEDRLTKRKVSKNKKLQQAAKDIDWAKNKFAQEFKDEFGHEPDEAVMDYINSF